MKAAINEYGDESVLNYTDAPRPEPKADDGQGCFDGQLKKEKEKLK